MRARWLLVHLILITVWVTAGCGPKPGLREDLVWPGPPDTPRIRYLRSLSSAEDLKQTSKTRLREALLGQKTKDKLIKPYGVVTDSRGRVFVSDGGNYCVVVFNEHPRPEEKYLMYLGTEASGRLSSPLGIAIDDSDFVYVGDVQLNRVYVYGPDLKFRFSLGDWSTFSRPSGIAFNPVTNEIIVLDSGSHDMKFFDRQGNLLRTVGGPGREPGYFNFPTNVAVDARGRIFVVDTMNFRIQIFSPDGEFISRFGQADNVPGSFSRPRGIALDSEGHVYVSDAAFSNVQIFQDNGMLLLFFGNLGSGPGDLRLPAGLWMDKNDRLFVADQYNERIQIFQYLRY